MYALESNIIGKIRSRTAAAVSYTPPAMPIEIDIGHVAKLARLDLSEDELSGYRSQLGDILEHAAQVQSLEGEPSTESEHPLGLSNTYREDERRPSLNRDEVLDQAPEARDGFFVVPPAMETE